MKRSLLLIILPAFIISFAIKAENVSKEVEKKGILIENFTGIHCGFCPQGHAIADDILSVRPGKAYTIAIHAGYYAVPYSDEPNFIVDDGVAVHDGLDAGSYGYPSGTVNRRVFDGHMITGRGSWQKDSKTVNSEDAPVNLYLQSSYDGNTRKLTVDVELYYTADVEQDVNYLSVAYIESNILGPQSGANMGSSYSHQHMLRGYITDVWGDAIENPVKGMLVERTYTFTLPESINEVPVTPSGVELVAFVTANKTDVLNVTGTKPSYVNYEVATDAVLSHPKFLMSSEAKINRSYAFNYFDIRMKNYGSTEIRNAGFEVVVNGNVQNVMWEGNIPPFESLPITINIDEYFIEPENNTYSIRLASINGKPFEGNTLSGYFKGPTVCTSKLFIEIQTDNYADENRFFIKNRDGEVVKELGPYPGGIGALHYEEVELEKNKVYTLEILDEWGDGIKNPSRGYLKLYNADNSLFYMSYDIPDWGLRIPLETSKDATSVESVENSIATYCYMDKSTQTINLKMDDKVENLSVELYSIDGKQLYNIHINNASDIVSIPAAGIPTGVCLIKITNDMKTEIIKIFVH